MRRSIFFDRSNQINEMDEYLKEFLQDEESKGTHIRLPKFNDDIIVIKEQGKLIIKLYDIKKRKVVRQIKI